MSKDRQFVAKGTPRKRHLIRIDDKKDKKRFLTYNSKGKAESAFKNCGFYGQTQMLYCETFDHDLTRFLDAVPCSMVIETKE